MDDWRRRGSLRAASAWVMPLLVTLFCVFFVARAGAVEIKVAADTDRDTLPFLAPLQPGRDRPIPEATPVPPLDFTIQAPRRSPVPRAVEDVVFDVKDIRVTGATAYSAATLRALTEPLIGKSVHLSDLIAVADKIEALYRNDGYILSRAYVPTQNVADGVFQISVVEGYIAAVSVQTDDRSARATVEALLAPVLEARPLKLAVLEHALLTAGDLPGIVATGLLRPSPVEPGASDLVVTVTTTDYSAGLALDNRGAPSSGFWTLAADGAYRSPFGDGGQIQLNASTNPANVNERYAFQGKYALPLVLADQEMTASLGASDSHGQPAGTSAKIHLITSNTTVGPRLSVPLLLNRQDKLIVEGGLTVESANVGADVEGGVLSHDEWRVADIGVSFQDNGWANGITNGTLVVAQGIPAFGASPSGSVSLSRAGGQTTFTKFTGLVHRVQPIDGPLSASVSLQGQYSAQVLLTGEEISFGGAAIGRGYDPGAVLADKGVGGAFELRYDLDARDVSLDSLQFYAYFDTGKVWSNASASALQADKIASAGGGFRTTLLSRVSIGLECGRVLIPVPGSENGERSSRVMVNTSVRF